MPTFKMQKLNRDIGSSFYELHEDDHEFNLLNQSKIDLNFKFSYYYSGRNAILALLKNLTKNQTINIIWLPQYYCDTVVKFIHANFKNTNYYPINPFELDAKLDINSFAKQNDIVILNNFWGLSSYNYQAKSNKRPIIIEDYSDAWLSKQCLNSKADYCICSLRKTYPIPLGAILWKPNSKRVLNFYEEVKEKKIFNSLEKFQNSMLLKRHFIKENNKLVKDEYLKLLNEAEALLDLSNNYISPNEKIVNLIKTYIDLDSNPIKEKHLKYIFKHLNSSQHFKIIKKDGLIPFGLLLLFKDLNLFVSFKKNMIFNHIYPAHLWPHNSLSSPWKYLFNIHVDFRYNIEDMAYICVTINDWIRNNS